MGLFRRLLGKPETQAEQNKRMLKLTKRLENKSEEKQEKAIRKLREFGPAAIPHLAEILRRYRSSNIRLAAARAIASTRHPDAIPYLVNALSYDQNEDVRRGSADALADMQRPDAITSLVHALPDEEKWGTWRRPWFAASALAKLAHRLKDETPEGKEEKALQLIGPHLRNWEHPDVVLNAYQAALAGKITPANARLFVKELRAVKGSLK